MRKLKLQVQMTVDGYIAGPNSELDWAVFNWGSDINNYVKELTEPVGTILLGRKLAQGFIPHWAALPENEDVLGVAKMNNTPKVVFTKTIETTDWPNTVLANGDLVEEVLRLKNQPGGDLIAYGGATFVSGLVRHNLIDEYHLFINPAAIGSGLTIFKELPQKLELKLVNSTAFECGIVVLHYVPKNGANAG